MRKLQTSTFVTLQSNSPLTIEWIFKKSRKEREREASRQITSYSRGRVILLFEESEAHLSSSSNINLYKTGTFSCYREGGIDLAEPETLGET